MRVFTCEQCGRVSSGFAHAAWKTNVMPKVCCSVECKQAAEDAMAPGPPRVVDKNPGIRVLLPPPGTYVGEHGVDTRIPYRIDGLKRPDEG